MHGMRNYLPAALLAVALTACGPANDATGIGRDRFVDVVVELRLAALETRGDVAAFEARKAEILRAADVTEDEMRAYVERHGEDLEHMAEVWGAINRRLSDREMVEVH
jgi:hypothetical protein